MAIAQAIGDKKGVGRALNSLASAYLDTGQDDLALESLQQALTLYRAIQASPEQSITLSNLGVVFAKRNQPELAIIFHKAAINITERKLPG